MHIVVHFQTLQRDIFLKYDHGTTCLMPFGEALITTTIPLGDGFEVTFLNIRQKTAAFKPLCIMLIVIEVMITFAKYLVTVRCMEM